ncbi:MAG TPA: HDOD domain-containing protein [Candidatus Binatia bacterium]|nr:HDOD domain-containing protein [Candidatus Binatia bacterium]
MEPETGRDIERFRTGVRRFQHVSAAPQIVTRIAELTADDPGLGISVWGSLGEDRNITPVRRHALWRHSLTVAALARRLAERARLNASAAFMCGLLHDVGKLVLGLHLGEPYWSLLEGRDKRGADLVRLEAESFGSDHATVGGWVLSAWRLPASIVEVVSDHHAKAVERLPEIVTFADDVVTRVEQYGSLTLPPGGLHAPTPRHLAALYADAAAETQRLATLLR